MDAEQLTPSPHLAGRARSLWGSFALVAVGVAAGCLGGAVGISRLAEGHVVEGVIWLLCGVMDCTACVWFGIDLRNGARSP